MASQAATENSSRPLPNFPPSVWGSTFASLSVPSLESEFEALTKEVEILKENIINEMLMQSTIDLATNIEFINLLCRLGVSYHFEGEIEKQLDHIFAGLPDILERSTDYSLYTSAILFRVLRQHGYNIPSDVFKKFKDNDGEFKESLCNDPKGLLALYEATFLIVDGEDILDEALEFTRQQLEISSEKSIISPHLAQHIKAALFRPFHHGIKRLEAMQYIPLYERDESRNEALLEFAKLDFNRLQLLYRKELAILTRWWDDLDIKKDLPYARDRIVECFVWIVSFQFEPQYSTSRIMGTKYAKIVSLTDDTYDSYGTFDELQRFAKAFERCNIDAIDELPNYMKVFYKFLLSVFAETENDENEGIRRRTCYAKQTVKEIVRSYVVELGWVNEGIVPTFDEYMTNGLVTCACDVLLSGLYIKMGDFLGEKEFQWIESTPKIIRLSKSMGRLMNDILPHEVEKEQTGNCTLGVKSYMEQYGVSQEEAMEEIRKLCKNGWKDINQDCMKPTVVPRIVVENYVQLARLAHFFYESVDYYTHSIYMKDILTSLFLKQL
ncbi:probable terpene synthase 6 [Mercurialis annua]|uniref:probable terpene synthase 6 n=1 Tax=Mercurialis annua TaxID=3986 RepID=UPI00215E5329|nr:probable terpene synthase 6 [Mercurialis annua]